jgi:hypothetical protein
MPEPFTERREAIEIAYDIALSNVAVCVQLLEISQWGPLRAVQASRDAWFLCAPKTGSQKDKRPRDRSQFARHRVG